MNYTTSPPILKWLQSKESLAAATRMVRVAYIAAMDAPLPANLRPVSNADKVEGAIVWRVRTAAEQAEYPVTEPHYWLQVAKLHREFDQFTDSEGNGYDWDNGYMIEADEVPL